ncbi:MAG: hypothetical protein V4858_03110 [Pseudomonadota bacterium]
MKNQTAQSLEAIAVLENQKAIASSHAAIATLEKAIGKCETQLSEQQTALPDTGPLLSQRADLLADTAIGEDRSAEIKKLDAKLEQLAAQRSGAKPAMDALKQTAEGLRRKLVDAQAALQTLEADKNKLLRAFMCARAEALGVEYLAAAKSLVDHYKRLRALGVLLHGYGDVRPLFSSREGLFIPRVNVEAMPPTMFYTSVPGAIFPTLNQTHLEAQDWMGLEKAALLEIGIEIA